MLGIDPATADKEPGLTPQPFDARRVANFDFFLDHACAERLAALLGTETAEFPGGHNGSLTHPAGHAARLREVLGAAG
ncbi:hypothetical protein [Streptomyces sp. NPDC101132]|uniref:hypothetical protein n=1 Tax=Streptomyces sp. NPDC101132 TaxID=3366110 RepID=UPI003809D3B3